jgi:hypothetical protein
LPKAICSKGRKDWAGDALPTLSSRCNGGLTVWMQGDSIWNLLGVPAYDPDNARAPGR